MFATIGNIPSRSDRVRSDTDPNGWREGKRMSRPQRFPNKIEFWTTDGQLRGLELLCADGLTDKASHLRQAVALYLRHFGISSAPQPAQPNGQHQEAARAL
jgi:hypothetical protein